MTIECTVLAKTGDEVGDGPMASVQLFTREDGLFGCGCTLMYAGCAASRGLSAATALSSLCALDLPQSTCRRLQEQSQDSADSVVTLCISAPHVSSLRLQGRRSHAAIPHQYLIAATTPALWPPGVKSNTLQEGPQA